MKSYIQVLGAGTPDGGGPAILIFFDDERYLINCGEGLQRFCGEHRIKLSKLSHIFLSRLDWDCAGGITGLISTLADAGGCPHLQLVGPKNTQHVVAAMRPFLQRSSYSVKIEELSDSTSTRYKDGKLNISVIELEASPIGVCSPCSKKRKSDPELIAAVENLDVVPVSPGHFLLRMFKDPAKYGTLLPEAVLQDGDHYRCVEHDRMTSLNRLPRTTPTKSSLVWCIEGPETPGKFLAQKAKELGVPNGPLNGRLTKGESVELPDGRIITPDMCVGPPTPGPVFILIDCPTIEHAKDLVSKVDRLASCINRVTLVIHYAPPEVFHSEVYAGGKFIDWPAAVNHLHITESTQVALESPALFQVKLKDPSIYHVPWYSEPADVKPLSKFHWIGTAQIKGTLDLSESNEFLSRMSAYPPGIVSDPFKSELLVTILGTGAALPGKYRNVSSTLLSFPNHSVLLDCGEGSTGQLLRAHGLECFLTLMKSIKTVFISHFHADHHAGLVGFLRKRHQIGLSHQELTIIAPQRYALWLEEYGDCVPIGPYSFVSSEDLVSLPWTAPDGLQVQAVPVEHCPRSFASVITHRGLKIVFSGDTRPCQRLVDMGKDADLLIHEATMGDDLLAEAIDKRHSTVSEAIGVGRLMAAKHILLNHFSQRYSRTAPPLPPNSDNVSVAFDLMVVPIERLALIEGNEYNERIRQLLPETDLEYQ